MKITTVALALAFAGFGTVAQAQSFSEGFDNLAIPDGWSVTNNSTRAASGNPWSVGAGITDADGAIVVPPQAGESFALNNYSAVGVGGNGTGTISSWLISPQILGIANGATFSFYTTTTPASIYPDRMEFRLSTAGAGVDVGTTTASVGSFTTVLLSVNPTLVAGGYPDSWTQLSATVSGLAAPVDGRIAFRYFVTNGGVNGANSNIIGVDTFSYVAAVPEPSTWALMLFGACGLVGLQRLRRRTS